MTDEDRVLEVEVMLQGYAHWSLGYIRGSSPPKWRTACGAVAPDKEPGSDAPSYTWGAMRDRCPVCVALVNSDERISAIGGGGYVD